MIQSELRQPNEKGNQMAALPKRRISTGRSGRRRKNIALPLNPAKKYVSSRDRRAAKRGTASEA
jgi:hypothetical protein